MTKTIKNPAKKTATVKNPKTAALAKVNLNSVASKLEAIPAREVRERESIYLYPATLTKEQISGDKGKSFRNSMRTKRDNLINNICFFAKDAKKGAELKEAIVKFNAFYKENYQRQDYTVASLSQKHDDVKNAHIILALEIIALSKGKK